MTEASWLKCTWAGRMLRFVDAEVSDRKLRLFACACCRRFEHLLTLVESMKALEVAERFADGLASENELQAAADAAFDVADNAITSAQVLDLISHAAYKAANDAAYAAADAAWGVTDRGGLAAEQVSKRGASIAFYRSIAYPAPSSAIARQMERAAQCGLLREILGNPFRPQEIPSTCLRWNDGTVPKIAQAIYDERRFEDMPILADALEDAGCDNEDILRHCREPGEHVRGCWVVDLLLAKE